MSVIRRAQEGNFTIMPNSTIRDPRLSIDALGLLLRLVSLPPNWEVHPEKVQEESKIGDSRWRRISKELIDAGYLTRSKERQENGRWDWVFTVYQESQVPRSPKIQQVDSTRGFSTDGSSTLGTTTRGKSTDITKKDLIKKDQQKQKKREDSPAPQFSRRDLVITDEMRNWAASVTPLVNIEWESQIFVDHPTGQSQRFNSSESLLGAWRTWMMRGQKYAEQQRSTSQRRSLFDDLNDTSWAEGL
ncbi:hypothetical protein ID104_13710 [Vibrio cholerae]|jgi:hypothetical protein|uniref:Helix-turn-helix domain-containing protein n=1 Tax=Shewanella algae TaxID=38313 RepID=A0A380AA60_9GAMM|nr:MULTISPECIES: hypothetical protein [Shewanella]EGR0683016.1 hypothetical protein [Vibrio cholerae]EHG8656512.1 hypothetical protein [Salmonella enterica subsp. enterica serovar Montevideo]EHG8658693.1 hypothetical protein [Salmonella enterica subsp. enterica serovar Montevideo]MBO2609030.1 hypothetical protein [Shewanella algae]MCA0951622.1 hypothetical protein [Shewanella chilikensis]